MPTIIFKSNVRFEGSAFHLLREDVAEEVTPEIRAVPWVGPLSFNKDFTEKDGEIVSLGWSFYGRYSSGGPRENMRSLRDEGMRHRLMTWRVSLLRRALFLLIAEDLEVLLMIGSSIVFPVHLLKIDSLIA